MHNRQCGAAHVPIVFFILILVMFLGTLVFAWMTANKNSELIKERDDAVAATKAANERQLLADHYIAEIGRVIAKPGKYTGKGSIYGDAKLDGVEGVMNPAEIKQMLDKACADSGLAIATGLENVLAALVTHGTQLASRAKDAEGARDKAQTEKAEVDAKFRTATSEASTAAATFSQGLEQARSEFEAAKLASNSRIANLEQNLRDKDSELATAREASATTEKGLRGEIAKHKMHNSALTAREQLRQPEDVADGKIVGARDRVNVAFINLGTKDLLARGTTFRIRTPRGNEVKGYATVTRVEEERAEVELSNVKDPIGDWVREGDLLFNELYTPRMSRTIYLMGRFSAPYNKPELAAMLKRLGNKVVEKMGPGVDTVVLGDDPLNEAADGFSAVTDSEEYKLAVDLHVEFAPLRKIRDLVKL